MQTDELRGLLQRSSNTARNTAHPGELPADSTPELQNIATQTERYLAAAESAIDRVLETGDSLSFLQGMRQESGQ